MLYLLIAEDLKMIPTCIRAPRSIQGSTDDVTRQTRSILQVIIVYQLVGACKLFELQQGISYHFSILLQLTAALTKVRLMQIWQMIEFTREVMFEETQQNCTSGVAPTTVLWVYGVLLKATHSTDSSDLIPLPNLTVSAAYISAAASILEITKSLW